MVEAELYTHLVSDADLKALVDERIYPIKAPENCETPFITYQNINERDNTSLQGDNYSNRHLFQLDIFSKSYSEVKGIKGAVKSLMYEFKYQPHEFNSRDLFEKDTELYRQLIEFNLIEKGQ